MTMHATATNEPRPGWVPLTNEIADSLFSEYSIWIDSLTEIRQRMAELRAAADAGWVPSERSQSDLDHLNARDEYWAMHDMALARSVLLAAEFEARAFFPADRANNIYCAMMAEAAKKNRPNAAEIAKVAEQMRAVGAPLPSAAPTYEPQPFKIRIGPQLLGRKGRR
jgi:hypothetical protein